MLSYLKNLIWSKVPDSETAKSTDDKLETRVKDPDVLDESLIESIPVSPIQIVRRCEECKVKYPESLFSTRRRKKIIYHSKKCKKCYNKLFSWNR